MQLSHKMAVSVLLTSQMELKQLHVYDRGVPRRRPYVVGGDAAPQPSRRHLRPHADASPVHHAAQHVPEQTRKQVQLGRRQRPTQRQQTAAELRRRLYVATLSHTTHTYSQILRIFFAPVRVSALQNLRKWGLVSSNIKV